MGALLPALAALAAVSGTAPATGGCGNLIPHAASGPIRRIEAKDIVQLRDIGEPSDTGASEQPLAVSPDGKWIAFQLRRADPDSNSYCLGLVVIGTRRGSSPRLVNQGGDYMARPLTLRGNHVGSGLPRIVRPLWAPDSQSLSYLRRDGDVTRIWRAFLDGAPPLPITPVASDIENFGIDGDGKTLVFMTSSIAAADRAIDREGLSGFLYDERSIPVFGMRPLPRALPPSTCWRLPTGGVPIVAAPADCMVLNAPTGSTLWLVHRFGWASSKMAIERHDPGKPVSRLFQTEGVISGCEPGGGWLACLIQGSSTPKALMLIDTNTGKRITLFDPNPEFRRMQMGKVRRLEALSPLGEPVFADLVLPPGHRAGQKHPLVIVQYRSTGFLRGGTGDEYPILALAARGLAVLSFQMPDTLARKAGVGSTDSVTYMKAIGRDYLWRWSPLRALERMIDAAVATGSVDANRIAISGLSDGASTVQFALLNSRYHFAAAAMSTCCDDLESYATLGGPDLARYLDATRFPGWSETQAAPPPYSFIGNAAHVHTPILMQLADREAPFALASVKALEAAGRPVELRIFPDEHHVKWQPAHRLAIYEHAIDWFDFWLNDRPSPTSQDRAETERWVGFRRAMRALAN